MAEFKKGAKVRFVDTPEAMHQHCHAPQFYPLPGTVGEVVEDITTRGELQVRWPEGSVKGPPYVWWVLAAQLEPVENTVPDYYIRVTATSEHDAQVEVNGSVNWVHEALAQVIMKLNPDDPLGVLASVITRSIRAKEEDGDNGTE